MAEMKKLPTKYQRPAVNDRVRDTIIGPRNPPRLPTELISPIDAAAAESLKS
jgi:hypothetical protein